MLQCDTQPHVTFFTSLALIARTPAATPPALPPFTSRAEQRWANELLQEMMITSESELSTRPGTVLQGTVLFCR